jgi:hypothetical protein
MWRCSSLGRVSSFKNWFCDVVKVAIIQKIIWLHTRYESQEKKPKNRHTQNSWLCFWLPTRTYHRNLAISICFPSKSGEFVSFFLTKIPVYIYIKKKKNSGRNLAKICLWKERLIWSRTSDEDLAKSGYKSNYEITNLSLVILSILCLNATLKTKYIYI